MLRLIYDFLYTLVVFFFCLFLYGVAKADNVENILQSIERIEKDIKDLQKEVYRGKNPDSQNMSDSSDNNIAVFDIRIRDIENQISQLTSYVEEYIFQIDELNNKIDDLTLLYSTENLNNNTYSENNSEEILESESVTDDNYSNDSDQTLGTLSIVNNNEENQNNIEDSLEISILPDVEPEKQYQFAFDLLRSQKIIEAKLALEEFIKKNEDNLLAGSAAYWIGEILYLQGSYKESALIFAESYQKYPESKKVPDMLLKLSMALSKIEKNEQACSSLNELINKYPDSKLIKKAELEKNILNCN